MTTSKRVHYGDVLLAYAKGPAATTEATLGYLMDREELASFALLGSQADPQDEGADHSWERFISGIASLELEYKIIWSHWGRGSNDPSASAYTTEPAVFIYGINQQQAALLGNKYGHSGWLYAGPETDSQLVLGSSDESVEVLGNWSPTNVATGCSMLAERFLVGATHRTLQWLDIQGERLTSMVEALIYERHWRDRQALIEKTRHNSSITHLR